MATHENRRIMWDQMWVRFSPPFQKAQKMRIFGLTMVTPTGIEPVLQP
jgi:hypothetical protein